MYQIMKHRDGLKGVYRYHRRKIKQGQAELLYAGNMVKETEKLTWKERQFFIERLQSLNDRVRKKTLHIFLSWHKDDIIDNDKMKTICREFMQGIGLGQQPYDVIRHRDTRHAHAHIVTTDIRPDGTKINLWVGRRQRLQLLRRLEQKYGLYQAGQRLPDAEWARQHPVQKVVYGVTPLKATMNAVLEAIVPTYKYTSLEELNAVLRPYQIKAGRGQQDSVTYRNNGLLYWPLKPSGEPENVYIKSSALRYRPTLRKLQERFTVNRELREEHRQRLTTAIDWIFFKQSVSMEAFKQALQKERISVVENTEANSGRRQIYYIDQLSKGVWDGEKLGRSYSAAGISERSISDEAYRQQQQQKQAQVQQQKLRQRPRFRHDHF